MKLRILTVVLILCAFHTENAHSQALKSDTINVLNYSIDLDLRYLSHKKLYASTEITITPRMASVSSFSLDLRKLSVDSVFLNGNIHPGYSYNDTVLRIILSTPFASSDTFVLKVVYHGEPLIEPYNWGGFHFLADSSLAFNLGVAFDDYPHNYGRIWFPCLDDFIDRATYDIFVRTKSSHKAVCGGMLEGTVTHPDSSITWHWRLDQPIPTYLASVAVGDLVIVQGEYPGINDTIPTMIYVRPADSLKAVNSFSNLIAMMSVFESRYGSYRWPRVGYTGTTIGAMEHATNIAMPRNLITGNNSYDWLIAHELSHSWFGNLVTCSSAEDMWINEGWARFSESVYFEGVNGWEAYKANIMDLQKNVLNYAHTGSSGGDGSWLPLYPVPQTHTYGTTVYDKGGLIAHTLRGYLGDSVFFDAIKAFLGHFAFQPVSSYQMRDFLSLHTGVNLTPFFDGWVFTPGFPHFSIDSTVSVPVGNEWDITVYVKQKMFGRTTYTNQNLAEIGFYDQSLNGEIRRLQFSGATGNQTFRLPFNPVLVLMDPEDRLADAITAKTAVISATGTYQHPNMFFSLRSNSHADDFMIRIEHCFVLPDSMPQPVNGLTLSPNRYWKISGVFSPNNNIDGLFNYSISNQFDKALITNTTDSLIIMYRTNAGETWQGIPFTKSSNPNTGVITVPGLQPGEYVLAKWDKDHIGAESMKDTPEGKVAIYPNPASHNIIIKNSFRSSVDIRIYNLQGTLLKYHHLNFPDTSCEIPVSDLSRGLYMIEVSDNLGKIIRSEKITIKGNK